MSWLQAIWGPVGELIDKVQAIDPLLRALLAGLAALLEMNVVTGLLLPTDTLVLLAAAAVESPWEGILLGVSVALGSFIGQLSGFWLGRWVGPRARGRWIRRRAGEGRIGPVERMIEARGGPWILASRFIPVLRTVTPFVVGLHGFPFRRFAAWSAASCVIWAGVYVPVYATASSVMRDGTQSPILGAALVLVGVFLFGASVLAQRIFDRLDGARDVRIVDV